MFRLQLPFVSTTNSLGFLSVRSRYAAFFIVELDFRNFDAGYSVPSIVTVRAIFRSTGFG